MLLPLLIPGWILVQAIQWWLQVMEQMFNPVHKNRFLFAVAETYDAIVTIPEGKLEIIATAQVKHMNHSTMPEKDTTGDFNHIERMTFFN